MRKGESFPLNPWQGAVLLGLKFSDFPRGVAAGLVFPLKFRLRFTLCCANRLITQLFDSNFISFYKISEVCKVS
jgi:uncharacterized membrane protein